MCLNVVTQALLNQSGEFVMRRDGGLVVGGTVMVKGRGQSEDGTGHYKWNYLKPKSTDRTRQTKR